MNRALPIGPSIAYVLVWCSGYVAGPAAVRSAEPFASLTARFALATVVAAAIAWWRTGRPRIDRRTLGRIAAVGLMMNAVVFGSMYLAFDVGMGATLASLLHALSPVLTAVLAALVLGERLTRLQAAGFGLGVVGVLIVLGPDVAEAGGPLGIGLGLLSLVGLSTGTLGQRWFAAHPDRPAPDPWWAATIQFAVCIPPMLVLAATIEGVPTISDPGEALVSVLWLAVINSVVGLLLLGALVRRGGAGASASLYFVCPPVTAVMAWIAFGDVLDTREWLGVVIAVAGVAIATGWTRRTPVAA